MPFQHMTEDMYALLCYKAKPVENPQLVVFGVQKYQLEVWAVACSGWEQAPQTTNIQLLFDIVSTPHCLLSFPKLNIPWHSLSLAPLEL